MRKHIFAAALIAGTAFSLPAFAQYSGTVGVTGPVRRHHRRGAAFRPSAATWWRSGCRPYAIPDRVVVGARCLKPGVVYYDVPERFGATTYRYTIVNDRTVLVDPRSRRIMQVLD